MVIDRGKKKLIIGAAKPWEVIKLLNVLNSSGTDYDIFTVDQYKDFFDSSRVYTFGIKSPYHLVGVIKALKTFYKRYDEVVIVNIFPYNFVYRMIVIFSSLFSRESIFLWFRDNMHKENPGKQLLIIALSPFNVILIPIVALIPICTLIYSRFKNV